MRFEQLGTLAGSPNVCDFGLTLYKCETSGGDLQTIIDCVSIDLRNANKMPSWEAPHVGGTKFPMAGEALRLTQHIHHCTHGACLTCVRKGHFLNGFWNDGGACRHASAQREMHTCKDPDCKVH